MSTSASIVLNRVQTDLKTQLANERNPGTANQYGVSVPECNSTRVTTTGSAVTVATNPSLLFDVIAEAAAATITIKDQGVTILTLTIAANTRLELSGRKVSGALTITTDQIVSVGWRNQ